jgi:biopolymer transport protein TolR
LPFLRKGFLKSANRPNHLYCSINASPVAAVFVALLFMFMVGFVPNDRRPVSIDWPVVPHAHKLPYALREDAIEIAITRNGAVYFCNRRTRPLSLPNQIRTAVYDGSEKRIYLVADARAKYGDVKAILAQIQSSGVENVSLLVETPYHSPF